MSTSEPMLTEGLRISRVGAVAQATATIWPNDDPQAPAAQHETRTMPIVLPAQFAMGGGWQLTHLSPTSGGEVTQNWVVDLFHDTLYLNSIRLHTYYLRNTGLLDSIAAVFAHLQAIGQPSDERYGYEMVLPAPLPAAGGEPNLLYYKPLQGGNEQFLMLYDRRYVPDERGISGASFVNIYEIVQVTLDEPVFLRLLREALEAGFRARP